MISKQDSKSSSSGGNQWSNTGSVCFIDFCCSLKCFPLFTSYCFGEWQSLTVEPPLEPVIGRRASSGDPLLPVLYLLMLHGFRGTSNAPYDAARATLRSFWGGRNKGCLQGPYIVNPRTREHVSLHGVGELRCQMVLRLLISWFKNRETFGG